MPGTGGGPVEIGSKDGALESARAGNGQREDMHPAAAIAAYRAIIDSGKDVDDVAASFGVSPAYVRRVLKLAALHPTILKAFQKDEIGMGAVRAAVHEHIPHGDVLCAVIATDVLLPCGVSNWGCYAILAALAILTPTVRNLCIWSPRR